MLKLSYIGSALFVVIMLFVRNVDIYEEHYADNSFRPVILANIKELNSACRKLDETAQQFKAGKTDITQLRNQLAKTRLVYKKNEVILEYYYPKHSKAYLNGAALKHLDPFPFKEEYSDKNYYVVTPEEYSRGLPLDQLDVDHYRGEPRVIDPVGLQALDELIFSDEAATSASDIAALTQKLLTALPSIEGALEKRNYFYDFEVLEASRLELIRIFSMGVTGFDTPGSLNGVEEAAVSIRSIEKLLISLIEKASPSDVAELKALFGKTGNYLAKNNDFNRFDRLTFLTDYINPLYKKLGNLQSILELPSSAQRWNKVPSWNASSDNIFSEDFLNPYFYSLLPKDSDSDKLRDLGRKLFYEPLLSKSGTMSCASCHKPELAFTDGVAVSAASVKGKTVTRNAPTLINSVYADRYFYDLRAFDLEEQAEHVISSHLEFDTDMATIVKHLNDNEYKKLFEAVFPEEKKVTRSRFAQALSSYVLSLRSFNSPFDKYIRGETKMLPKEVKDGFNLFMGRAACGTCHYAPTFSGLVPPLFEENESEVLGVFKNAQSKEPDTDAGRFKSGVYEDGHEIYRRSFKTVTVRNAGLTAPYFHNGGYSTLDEVIDFYDKGGAAGVGYEYEVPNQTLAPDALGLSNKEKKAIIAFINSLSDNPYK